MVKIIKVEGYVITVSDNASPEPTKPAAQKKAEPKIPVLVSKTRVDEVICRQKIESCIALSNRKFIAGAPTYTKDHGVPRLRIRSGNSHRSDDLRKPARGNKRVVNTSWK